MYIEKLTIDNNKRRLSVSNNYFQVISIDFLYTTCMINIIQYIIIFYFNLEYFLFVYFLNKNKYGRDFFINFLHFQNFIKSKF